MLLRCGDHPIVTTFVRIATENNDDLDGQSEKRIGWKCETFDEDLLSVDMLFILVVDT